MYHFEAEGSQSVKLKVVHQLECATLKLKVLKVCKTEGCSSTGMYHPEMEASQCPSLRMKDLTKHEDSLSTRQ